ncbi:FCP1 homology domain [Trypanosoma melophagium]|uniref:FCP1 homology domain n=1 Tax=Trypanosoma melophagium TaxID=715481 RepID=UPI00351A8A10|nr:FCP1 homology domain [Trypanosoma melophagium]
MYRQFWCRFGRSVSGSSWNRYGNFGQTSAAPVSPKPEKHSSASNIFSRAQSSIHMYANKENAWDGYTDDRFYGAKRLKEYWKRMLKDRGVQYYLFGTIIIAAAGGSKLWQLQESQKRSVGLIGPKKKPYRSRLTVVMDVDETILSYGDKAFRMKAGMIPRPYLAELLDYLSSIDAEVVLWSACSERYMRQVLSVIDPTGVRISQYIVGNRDWFTHDNYYEKNICWLKRPLEDTLIVENRALSVRNCNANAILVDDFIRGEYMDTGQDHPPNDQALRTLKSIIQDLEQSGRPVPEYLADAKHRNKDIKEIPCHLAFRQLPDELARGVFYFVGAKYKKHSSA